MAHGLAEFHVGENLSQIRILIRNIKGKRTVGASGIGKQEYLIVACRLVFLQHSIIRYRQRILASRMELAADQL